MLRAGQKPTDPVMPIAPPLKHTPQTIPMDRKNTIGMFCQSKLGARNIN